MDNKEAAGKKQYVVVAMIPYSDEVGDVIGPFDSEESAQEARRLIEGVEDAPDVSPTVVPLTGLEEFLALRRENACS